MIISGFFREGCAFIQVHLVSSKLFLDQPINFLVDTGASRTVISDRDALFLMIDYKKLRKNSEKLSGIGGSVETYTLDDTILIFKTDTGQLEIKLPILFLNHDLVSMKEEDQIKVLRIPSLLGRDILNRFRLIYSEPENKLELLISP